MGRATRVRSNWVPSLCFKCPPFERRCRAATVRVFLTVALLSPVIHRVAVDPFLVIPMAFFRMEHFFFADFAAGTLASRIQWNVFWPYFAGVALSVIGLSVIIKKETPQEHGLDKIVPFGRLFFAVPMAVFGAQHFTATIFVVRMIPSWIPCHLFWAYLVGAALIASALSIVVKKQARLAATLLGVMLLLFVLLMHIPNLAANPHDRILLAVALRDLSFGGGALVFAGAQTEEWRARGTHWIITIGRFLVAIPVVVFGVENFLHPDFVPGVPLNKITPAWIPGHILWSYLTGAVFIVAGLSIMFKISARLAAKGLGIMVLLLVLFVYLPMTAAIPYDIANGLNYLVDTLALSGSALLLAGALPKGKRTPLQ